MILNPCEPIKAVGWRGYAFSMRMRLGTQSVGGVFSATDLTGYAIAAHAKRIANEDRAEAELPGPDVDVAFEYVVEVDDQTDADTGRGFFDLSLDADEMGNLDDDLYIAHIRVTPPSAAPYILAPILLRVQDATTEAAP